MFRNMNVLFLFALFFFGACTQSNPAISSQPDQVEKETPTEKNLARLLEQIETRCNRLRTFQAKMHYEQTQIFIDDIKQQTGTLIYQADENRVQFRIHFDQRKQWDLTQEPPKKFTPHDEDFAFDGLWVTHRNARLKTLQRWQIAKTAKKKETFRLGHGAFPLPFAITKKDINDHFIPTLLDPDPNDPQATNHLQLMPKPQSPYAKQYHRFDLWVSRDQALPIQFSYETNELEIITSRWSDIRIDLPIKQKKFHLKPAAKDWTKEETPLKK
jgi:hypothetical protein